MSFRAVARFVAVRLLNVPRLPRLAVDADGRDVIVCCNSFYTVVERVDVRGARSVVRVCVVRGDVTSFTYQGPDGESPIEWPIRFLNSFDALVFVSRTTQANWVPLIRPEIRSYLLPNAIDEDEIDAVLAEPIASLRQRLRLDPTDFHVVVVGSIQTRKGQRIFADIAERLVARIPNVQVHFVGVVSATFGGNEVAARLRAAGHGRFHVHGHREDVLALLRCADVAACVSHSEAFPRSVAEYLAMGKATVSTRVAGADEMVTPDVGRLIDIGSEEQLLAVLTELHEDAALRERLGRAARDRYFALYSAAAQQDTFDGIFADIEQQFIRPPEARQATVSGS
jgi:glycosyltransferase involved in cell wall biosynthesis